MWTWLKDKWNRFHNWCASWAPGFKTFLVTALGALGSFGASAQEYLTGVPLDKFVTAQEALIITTVLFTLAFWFRSLSNRHA